MLLQQIRKETKVSSAKRVFFAQRTDCKLKNTVKALLAGFFSDLNS